MQTKLDILDIHLISVDKYSTCSHYIVLLASSVCEFADFFFLLLTVNAEPQNKMKKKKTRGAS